MGMTCRQLSMSLHMKLQPQRKKAMKLAIKAMKGIAVIATMQRRRHSSRRKRQQPMQ